MRATFFAALIAAVSQARPHDLQTYTFEQFVSENKLDYQQDTAEYAMRAQNF